MRADEDVSEQAGERKQLKKKKVRKLIVQAGRKQRNQVGGEVKMMRNSHTQKKKASTSGESIGSNKI